MQLRIGMVFHGYCGGAFGRDAYGPKRVEAFGADWIVARTESGAIVVAIFGGAPSVFLPSTEMDMAVGRWLTEEE